VTFWEYDAPPGDRMDDICRAQYFIEASRAFGADDVMAVVVGPEIKFVPICGGSDRFLGTVH
jgi:hypothetical protein